MGARVPAVQRHARAERVQAVPRVEGLQRVARHSALHQGGAVQFHPIKPMLKAPGARRLKIEFSNDVERQEHDQTYVFPYFLN
jgi:hypothetical protein